MATEIPNESIDATGELEALIQSRNGEAIVAFMRLLPPEDTAYTLSHLSDESRTDLFKQLSDAAPELGADLLEHFVDEYTADLIGELEPGQAAALVDEMDSDEQADVLSELDEDEAEAILQEMDPEEAEDARERMGYDEDVAGGLMITEYLVYNQGQTVEEVTRDLHEKAEEHIEFEVRYIYVVDDADRLTGVVPMRSLVFVPGSRRVEEQQIPEPLTVNVHTSLDDLHDLFDRVDLSAVPVIDDHGKLAGVVQRASVQEAIGDRESEQFLRFGGIIGGEELRSMSIGSRAARRLAFLLPIMLLLLASATVIALFEDTVKKLPILAAFLPVVAGICGSGGNQAVAVSIRELSLGLIDSSDFVRVLVKELVVALMIGLVLGVVMFVIVFAWQRNVHLALVLGGAIPFVVTVSKTIGGTVPVLLKKTGIDPAMASGPIVTTVVDLVGFFTVLMLATQMLDKLL
ncbi:MAG: magnesium transporter [Phycisphaeraceae bacterium]|nr:magnesium transporter [Phycisphaeraceae bacterium]